MKRFKRSVHHGAGATLAINMRAKSRVKSGLGATSVYNSALSRKEKADLSLLIETSDTLRAGIASSFDVVNDEDKILIVPSFVPLKGTEKVLRALVLGIPIVSKEWVDKSLEEG